MALTKDQMTLLFTNLVRADAYDKMFTRRMTSGRLSGFYHPAEGALAPGIGACTFLNKDDFLFPSVRGHGIGHFISKGIDPKPYIAEHIGKATGCCQGRSSFHCCFPDDGVYLASGFIGYNFPPMVGFGLAAKRNGTGQVAMNCSGDGSYGQGRAHEAMLMAMNWKLPIIFWCENNGLAIYARVEDMHPTEDIASLAQGYDMPSAIVDGQDVFACAEAAIAAVEHARSGKGPIFVEAKTCRFREHDIGTPDLVGYEPRPPEVIEELRKREPVKLATERMLGDAILTQDQIDQITADAEKEVEEAEEWADSSPDPQVTVEDLYRDVYAD